MGHTELVVEKISKLLKDANIENELHKAEQADVELIIENDKFLLATSTWEHGRLNPYFDKLLKGIEENSMKGKSAAFVGCGSTQYEHHFFCEGAKILRNAWITSNGKEIVGPFFLDGLPYDKLDTNVTVWAKRFISKLQEIK